VDEDSERFITILEHELKWGVSSTDRQFLYLYLTIDLGKVKHFPHCFELFL
jgi:hypothetical protein